MEILAAVQQRLRETADAALPTWWTEMSPDQQKEYLAEHPKSKFAQHIMQMKKAVQKHTHFLTSPDSTPDSPVRRSAAKMFKDKAVTFIKNVKEEAVDEWKHFAKAAHAKAHGHELTHHQKKAVQGMALKLITVGAPLLLSNPNFAHLGHILPELAHHYATDVLIGSLAKALIFAAVLAEAADPADKLAEFILHDFAKYLQSASLKGVKK